SRQHIAALEPDSGLATSWDAASNARVLSLALDKGVLYAGGDFSTIGGQARSCLAALDVTTGSAVFWNPSAFSNLPALQKSVNTITLSSDGVLAGGVFVGMGRQPQSGVARIPKFPVVQIGDRVVTEGSAGPTIAEFNVTLSPPQSNTVTVNYAT